jgi:hypothetical protein
MSTLILTLCSVFGNLESTRQRNARSQLLSLASRIYISTFELQEEPLLPLASRLQFRALEAEGFLEAVFASCALNSQRTQLALAREAIRKGQDALDQALENGLLPPEHFLELNADWETLHRRLHRFGRNLP